LSLERISKALTRNIGAKIVSLVFAFFLWLHVTAEQGENQSFRVPIAMAGIADSLTITHDVPEFIEVTIRGSRSNLMKLRLFGRLEATVDLSRAVKGRNTVPLSAAVINLPEQIDPREVTVDNPKTLVLNLEEVITKSVPVRIAYRGELPDDIIIEGSPVIIPSKVKITGASSVVGGIEVISTHEIDIKGRKGKYSEEADLMLRGMGIRVVPDKVLIEMSIHKRAIRTLANIPPTMLRDDESFVVEYSPRVVSLTIEGPEEIIREITTEDVSVILDLTGKVAGTYLIEPEVIVPKGIERYFLDVDNFEITILPPPGGRLIDQRDGEDG
jgi:YbbR domain-containing protein